MSRFILLLLLLASQADAAPKYQFIGQPVTVVFVHTSWCGPCRRMEPWMPRAVKSAGASLVDVDGDSAGAAKFRVRAYPTTILMRGNREVERLVGYVSETEIKKRIAKAKAR